MRVAFPAMSFVIFKQTHSAHMISILHHSLNSFRVINFGVSPCYISQPKDMSSKVKIFFIIKGLLQMLTPSFGGHLALLYI